MWSDVVKKTKSSNSSDTCRHDWSGIQTVWKLERFLFSRLLSPWSLVFWNVSQTINSKLNVNYVECMKGTNNSSATSGYISHYTWYVSFLLSSNGICNFNNPPVWPCSIQHNKKSAIWLQLLFQINTLTADWDENRIVCKTIHYCNVLWIWENKILFKLNLW